MPYCGTARAHILLASASPLFLHRKDSVRVRSEMHTRALDVSEHPQCQDGFNPATIFAIRAYRRLTITKSPEYLNVLHTKQGNNVSNMR